MQVSGIHWGRKEDRVGIAYLVDGLSSHHQDYLAGGDSGFMLGDCRLNYGWEQEFQPTTVSSLVLIFSSVRITSSFQNPGYNKDRGPVAVYSVRVRLSF